MTNTEKDILYQASVNVHEYEINESIILQAFDILVSLQLKSTPLLNKLDVIKKIKKDLASQKNKKTSTYVSDAKNGISKLLLSLVVGLIIMVFFLSQYSSVEDEKVMQERILNAQKSYTKKLEQKQKGDVDGAWVYMQMFVEQRLKSPKSADFPFGGGTYHTKYLGNGRYEVNSYVDSKNAFGAEIRTHFKGVIKRKDGGWVLEYLNFEK